MPSNPSSGPSRSSSERIAISVGSCNSFISIHAAIGTRHVGLKVLTPALFAARRRSSSRVAIGQPLRRASSRYDAS
jgi:hypothetical protein